MRGVVQSGLDKSLNHEEKKGMKGGWSYFRTNTQPPKSPNTLK